ncbi:MAG TPA: hypothetical protein DEO85_12280 [Maritimibacter sp.]|nr:hypothetical protein [Maritimibacter sp.]
MRALSIVFVAAFMALFTPVVAAADDLPDVQTCLNDYVETYEWLLEVHADTPLEDVEGGLWHVEDVKYCGTLGIVRCDRTGDTVPCQHALAARIDGIARDVRETLLPPEAVAGEPDGWAKRLYDASHALAFGSSAGDDCAGATPRMEAWCAAHEAGNRLRDAVMAWQVARYLGAVPSAVEAGWAEKNPAKPPKPRPER